MPSHHDKLTDKINVHGSVTDLWLAFMDWNPLVASSQDWWLIAIQSSLSNTGGDEKTLVCWDYASPQCHIDCGLTQAGLMGVSHYSVSY